jgi:hypothetical protein
MPELEGFPYFEVQFAKTGEVHDLNESQDLLDVIAHNTVTDLFVISHGWNNDMNEARGLYRSFFRCMRGVLDSHPPAGLAGRSFAILGVLWPSKKFAEQELIPSGAVSVSSPINEALLLEQVEGLRGIFDVANADAHLDQAKQLVPELEDSPAARREFAEHIRALLPKSREQEGEIPPAFFSVRGDTLMDRLSKPAPGAARGDGRRNRS